ncbi:MAG TPA: DUF6468 domain-containing protein [Phenylobacterium sp.]|jgi:hypothetical protein|nr:DUF6468 domain-containing protein [Phenylobacterium sp.]
MSIIGLAMNLLLAGLLMAALGMGWRLNRRLKALRDSHEGFAVAVAELNTAAARAEQGLADLRSATDEAVDILGDRIEKGRTLAARLDRLIEHAAVPQRAQPAASLADDPVAERRLGALLAAAREARPERVMPPLRPEALRRPEALGRADLLARAPLERHAPRARRSVEDDLFDDEPLTLNDVRGAAR